MAWGADAQRGADQWLAKRVEQEELARRAQMDQQKMMLDRIGKQEQTRQFDVNSEEQTRQFDEGVRQFDTGQAEKAAAEDQKGLFLGTLPPAMRQAIEAGGYGAAGVTQHDFEDEATHGQHIESDRQQAVADLEAKEQVRAKYRPKPQEPRERVVQVMGPNGTPIYVRESDAVGQPAAQAPRAVTGSERQTLAYYNRAQQASDDISGLEEKIAGQGMAGQLQGQYAPNMMQTEDQQLYRQAQRAFTEARLRKESGAAIPTGEYDNDARTYFAQPGDSPKVIQQKRQARQVVLDGLKNSSGKAYAEHFGDADGGSSGGPAPGTKRVINGTPAVWDGQGWVPQ